LALLYAQARRNPLDPRPRAFAGQLLLEMERPQDAARLLEAALRRNPNDAGAALDLARASAAMNGVAHQGAQQLFARAAMLDPANPVPWIYRGLAAQAENRREDAITAWQAALERIGADDPRRQMAQQMLAQALADPPAQEAKSPS
jgi:cytochrome c-type biogenesis protein CcmH/NrfG